MTNEQAKKQAQKRWGKESAIRNAGSFSSPDRRERASQAVREARAEIESIDKEVKERLAVCDWYQELQARRKTARKQIEDNQSLAMYHRFDVGRIGGVAGFQFFEVLGSGDTWEEAFAQADTRK